MEGLPGTTQRNLYHPDSGRSQAVGGVSRALGKNRYGLPPLRRQRCSKAK
jgi:hypothetical protein